MTIRERPDILAGLVEILCQAEERNKRKNNIFKTRKKGLEIWPFLLSQFSA
jgi:hypothetical protein